MAELKHPWWTVAKFEFLRVIRRADFVVSLVLMPLISVGASVGAGMRAKRAAEAPVKLAFVSAAPGVTSKMAVLDTVKSVTWFPVSGASAEESVLKEGIEAKRYDGAVLVPAGFARGDSVC
jgi:ABC-type Na+ efflux pump permease subunit